MTSAQDEQAIVVPPVACRTINYELTRADLLWGYLFVLRRMRMVQIPAAVAILYITLSSAFFEGAEQYPAAVRVYVGSTAAIVYGRKHRGILGAHSIEITDAGLVERTAYNESLQRWQGLDHIRESGQYLFLHINAGMVHQIPKRAFASAKHLQAFVRELHAFRSRAPQG